MKKFSLVIVIFIMAIGGIAAWWINGISAVNSNDKSVQTFTINKGDGVKAVANNLKSKGLIKDTVLFYLVIRKLGLDNKIQAGDFSISKSQNMNQIAKALQVGTSDVRIVIPEGKRAEEVAQLLKNKIDTYEDSWEPKLVLNEGYLFPDTYFLPRDADIEQVISLMRNNFESQFTKIENIEKSKLSKDDTVILASLVEREAKHQEDRPLVASVMFNRLQIGMPLQIDATVQYALGYQPRTKTWWKKDLTFDDLEINSEFNTYTNPGLPPRAIANPGYEVLNAVVNPAKSDYIFYITDKSGINRYGKTLGEHNANIKKYGL